MLWGLVAAILAAVLYVLGLAANAARAGTDPTAEPARAVAAPEAPLGIAPPAKSPEMVIGNQDAGAVASVTQQQPTNIVISIRVDSPGDNGPISQTNIAIGDAGSSNAASTTQGSVPDDGSGQDASTDQQAGAGTTVTQDGAGNLVVVVRINSPGNNGPVSQTNASVGTSDAQNTSGTTQSEPTEAPAPSTEPTSAAASGTSARTSRRRPHRKVAPAAPRREEAVATAPAPASPVTPAFTHRSDRPAAGSARANHHPRHIASAGAANRGRSAARGRGGWLGGRLNAGPLGRAVADTGDLLGTVAPRAPLGAPRRPADVSSPVLFSLFAVLALTAVFVAWSLRPERFRPSRLPRGLLR